MKKMKKWLCVVLVLSMVLLCACDSNQNPAPQTDVDTESSGSTENLTPEAGEVPEADEEHEPVTLRVYMRYSDDDTILPYDYMVEKLAEEMPWVTLELDPQASDDNVKIKSYAATGDMPDIFTATGVELIDTLIQSGSVANLTEYAESSGFADKVLPSSKAKLYHTDGQIYTLPYSGTETALLYVNQQLFEDNGIKIPETIDEMIDAAIAFNQLDIIPMALFAKEKWSGMAFVEMMITRYVPSGFLGLDNGTTSIDDPGYLQGAQAVLDLVDAGFFQDGATNAGYEEAAAMWYDEQCAMFMNGYWEIPTATENLGDKVTWIPIPAATAEDYEESQYHFVGGYGAAGGLGVSPYSENYDTAVEVAAFIAEAFAEYNYNQRGTVLIALDVEKELQVELSPMMNKLADYVPEINETTMLFGLTNTELSVTVQDECQRLIAGNVTAEEFVENIRQAIGQ